MIMEPARKPSASTSRDKSPNYWRQYSNIQKVKHDVIRDYLQGWFPKLALGPHGSSRLLYLDTHAGRGTHMSGELGSPLVALEALLGHAAKDMILAKTEVYYYFIERDKDNAEALKEELKSRTLPKNVFVEPPVNADCFTILEKTIADAKKAGKRLAPAFVFCDPYGWSLPGRILRELMEFPRVELFVNVIWRELDLAMQQIKGGEQSQAHIIDALFDGRDWKTAISAAHSDDRAKQCATLFQDMIGARWATTVTMIEGGRTKYFLLHLTNNDAGRDLMKDCVWSACPEDGYYARKSDHPGQDFLIERKPDLAPLRAWVLDKLSKRPERWKALIDLVRSEIWRSAHLNEVIKALKDEGKIEGEEGKKFLPSGNPLLRLAPQSTLF